MKEIRFNIEMFKIEDYNDWYKHYLIFLIRYFFNSDNFSWTFTKIDFINKWLELWFEKRSIENIYQKWKKDNPFIREIKKKWRNQYITIKSLFKKDKNSNFLVYVENYIFKRITDINIFRSFCYIIIASRPIKNEYSIKKSMYKFKNSSRTIRTIWEQFWNTEKSTMSKRLTKAQEIFWDIFKISQRYSYFIWFIVQLSNLYSIDGVRYKNQKNKKNIVEEYDEYKDFYIKPRFIKGDIWMFWEKPKKCMWFLNWEDYEKFWKIIKKEVFSK